MFCSKCGTVVADGAGFCSACGQPIASTGIATAVYSGATTQPVVAYAGFWLRFVALIIDGIVLGTVGWIVTLPFMASFGLRDILRGHPPTRPEDLFPFFGVIFRIALIRFVLNWLYYALFESSTWQATLGKKALGLEVTDLEGRRVSFGRASGRFFGKILSFMTIFIGFAMAGFTQKKQALHDMLAGCLVIRKL
jgi:uncharacterized RDD family membrane protein YckC